MCKIDDAWDFVDFTSLYMNERTTERISNFKSNYQTKNNEWITEEYDS